MRKRREKEIKDNRPLQGINGRNSSIGVPRNSRFDLKSLTTEEMIANLVEITGNEIPVDNVDPVIVSAMVNSGVMFFKIEYSELIKRTYQIVISGGRSNNHGPIDLSSTHWLPQVATGNGYPNINIRIGPGKNLKVYVHLLMKAVFEGRHRLVEYFESHAKNFDGPKLEVSHLCHERTCVNPHHLVIESHTRNRLREACRIFGICANIHNGRFCILGDLITAEASELIRNPVLSVDQENRGTEKFTGFSFGERRDQLTRKGQAFEGTIPVPENLLDLRAQLVGLAESIPETFERRIIKKKIEMLESNMPI